MTPPSHGATTWRILPLLIPLAIGAWLVTTSMSGGFGPYGVYDAKRIWELYLLLGVVTLTVVHPSQRTHFLALAAALPLRCAFAFGAILLLGLVSAFRLEHPDYALVEVGMLFMLVLAAMCVAAAYRGAPIGFERIVLVAISALGVGIIAQEGIAVLVYLANGQQYNYRESLIYFLHPRMYNHLQTWTLPLLPLLPLAFGKNRRWGAACVALIGFQWFIVLVTGARGSTLSLLLAMVLVGVFLRSGRAQWLRPQLLGAMVGVLLFTAVFALMSNSVPGGNAYIDEGVGRPMLHTSGRLDLWEHAIEDVARNPLLGAGPMHYGCDVHHYIAASPHNFPLQILAEWGIPAFLMLAGLFLWLARSWWQWVRNPPVQGGDDAPVRRACLAVSCVAAVIHMGASGLMIAPASQVAGILVAGWALGLRATDGLPENRANTHRMGIAVLLLGVACAASLAGFAWREQGEMDIRSAYAQDYGPITPRFWQHGKTCLYGWK